MKLTTPTETYQTSELQILSFIGMCLPHRFLAFEEALEDAKQPGQPIVDIEVDCANQTIGIFSEKGNVSLCRFLPKDQPVTMIELRTEGATL